MLFEGLPTNLFMLNIEPVPTGLASAEEDMPDHDLNTGAIAEATDVLLNQTLQASKPAPKHLNPVNTLIRDTPAWDLLI
eukprot:11518363-Alexandrium_andersonii.AAC.1